MPRKDNILNLPGFAISKVSTAHSPFIIDVHYRRLPRCAYCGSKRVRKKAGFIRKVRHESLGHRQTILRFKAYKLYCHGCQRYSNQQFPGIAKYQRASERLHKQIFHQHTEGISQQSLARNFKVGKATIERWYHKEYRLAYKEIETKVCPLVLGIDEHFFGKKQKYVTTLCDLRKHKIVDLVPGRCHKTLGNYLQQLPGRERVKVVCMDLSRSYRHIIQRYFPNAKIVADRFHVVRLMNHMCLQTYHQIDPKMKYQRGILAALRMRLDKLTPKRKHKREAYLAQQPAIAAIDSFKQRLHQLLLKKQCTAKRCRRLLPVFINMIESLKQSPFKQLNTLGKTALPQ